MAPPNSSLDPLDLLTEWLTYWAEQDHMPAKMPDALHVRTAVALGAAGRDPRFDLGFDSALTQTGRPCLGIVAPYPERQ